MQQFKNSYGLNPRFANLKNVTFAIDGSNRAIDHAKKLTKEFDVYSFCVYISVRLTLDRPNIETQRRLGADTRALCRPHQSEHRVTMSWQRRYVIKILISPDTASCHSVSLLLLARSD